MDGRTFDNISRTIAHGATRRRIVGAAIAAVFGNGIALGAAPASAVQRPTCRQLAAGCTRATQCCSGYCERRTSVPRRKRHRCGCGDQRAQCGSSCHDLQTDIDHCSACFSPCPETTDTCDGGECSCGGSETCLAGEICCDGSCYDKYNDTAHCGTCGNACDGGFCSSGTCVVLPCQNADFESVNCPYLCVALVNGEELFACGTNSQFASCTSSADCAADRAAFDTDHSGAVTAGTSAVECVVATKFYGNAYATLAGESLEQGVCVAYGPRPAGGCDNEFCFG